MPEKLSPQEIDHLEWMYHRLISVHKEDKNSDYMKKFYGIIQGLKPNRDPWTCDDCGNSVYNCKCQ